MKYSVLSLFLLVLYSNSFSQNESAPFMPDFSVKTDDYTVLIAQDGTLTGGLKLEQKADHRKFHVKGWTRKDQNITWNVNVPTPGNFEVNVLLQNLSSSPFFAEVSSGSFVVSRIFQEQGNKSWQRLKLNGTLRLNEGKQNIVLRIIPGSVNDTLNACVYSIELVLPSVKQRKSGYVMMGTSGSAMAMRANCQWFRDAGYGLMFHWTRGVSPLSGDPKPYADAVRDFNVDAFATQVAETGAGFVTLTTTHAFHYFPAPLKSLDSILPGRTAQRDLIADIADALGKRGIKLLLYYNLGSSSDPEWLKASGFWNSNPERFFNNWIKMISEIGERYKDKVAGFWFDDGTMSYYYRSAPWEKLARAAKTGYAQRMISYNPWVYPSATEFQDFYPGEMNLDPRIGGSLKPGDNGIISSGPYTGLQASAAIIMEKGGWVRRKNTEFSLPRWNSEQLAKMIQQYKQYKNVPMFNLEILEDGTFSPKTVEVFRYARKLLTNIAGPEIKTINVIPIETNKSTQLYGTTASQINGTLTRQSGDNFRWKGNSEMKWVINVPKSDKFDLYISAAVPANNGDIKLTFNANRNSIDYKLIPTKGPWKNDKYFQRIKGPFKNDRNFQRIKIVSQFSLTEGIQEISLSTLDAKDDKAIMDIRSLELVPNFALSAIEEDYKKALASRANSEWISKAGYGLMFHWTSQSVNSDGSCKTYQDAVNDFDVNSFVKMVDETGAGYIIFTIGHVEAYCPAPIASWEKYHPGMTTKRDLIGEIADKLGEKGIKLMCYLPSHIVGKQKIVNDFDFMKIHTEILQEIGERYKEKIVGYWFDSMYQNFEEYPNVSFEEFFKATKAGNPNRIIALNAWVYPKITPWQEYWTGEVAESFVDPPVNGHMVDGPVPDLRYQALLVIEPYWVQEQPDHPNPLFTAGELSQYIRDCMNNGGAVTINMGIFQDGTVGEKALDVMKQVRKMVRGSESSNGKAGK